MPRPSKSAEPGGAANSLAAASSSLDAAPGSASAPNERKTLPLYRGFAEDRYGVCNPFVWLDGHLWQMVDEANGRATFEKRPDLEAECLARFK